MSFKNTWRWLLVALALFGFIVFQQRFLRKSGSGAAVILPKLKAAAVISVQVRPAAQVEIHADRTNGIWQLVEPMDYPAQGLSIEKFLAELEGLKPASYIRARELQDRPQTDEEYGFATPQAFISIEQPGYTARLRVGAKTTPGDQVFLQVVGVEGVYVVNADFLNYLPRTADDWRDTTLINLNGLAFDRLSVTNGTKILELRRDGANKPWRMVYPLQARANNNKVEESLQMLQSVRVRHFVAPDSKAEPEAFGLHPAELEVALSQGTNSVARLQFGKSPTNDVGQVYARRLGMDGIVAVPKDLLTPWYAQVNEFRDPFLFTWSGPVAAIDVRGLDNFSLQQQSNDTWRILPQNLPADAGLIKEFLTALSGLQIIDFHSDSAIVPELPKYGLASPAEQYTLKGPAFNTAAGLTNTIIAEVSFGTNQEDKVFARRADEGCIYAVRFVDFQRLPTASWELRERRIWNFSTNDVVGVSIRQLDRVRHVVRNGPNDWSLAPGSQGLIDVLAVEETVKGMCQLTAVAWMARGEDSRTRYGFTDKDQRVTLELKNGDKATVEFSALASPNSPYAAVTMDGQLWIFQFPSWLNDYVQRYLSVPLKP
jgi:hypothetical protein